MLSGASTGTRDTGTSGNDGTDKRYGGHTQSSAHQPTSPDTGHNSIVSTNNTPSKTINHSNSHSHEREGSRSSDRDRERDHRERDERRERAREVNVSKLVPPKVSSSKSSSGISGRIKKFNQLILENQGLGGSSSNLSNYGNYENK